VQNRVGGGVDGQDRVGRYRYEHEHEYGYIHDTYINYCIITMWGMMWFINHHSTADL
jgi:hypothetical protein